MVDVIAAFRELDKHPDTIFTVLTGEGRFFSAGADVKAVSSQDTPTFANDVEKKVFFLARFAPGRSNLFPSTSIRSHAPFQSIKQASKPKSLTFRHPQH